MYVRLLFPIVACLVLSHGATAECSVPTAAQDSWSDTSPTEEAYAALEAKRFPEAAEALKRAGNDPMALYMLGCMYRFGSLGEPDIPRAIESLELAAKANCVEAAAALAEIRDDLATEASDSDLPARLKELEDALYLSYVLGTKTASTELSLLFTPPGPGARTDKAFAWALIAQENGVMGGAQLVKELTAAFPNSASPAEALKTEVLAGVEAARTKAGGLVQIQIPMEIFFPEGKAPKGSGGGGGNSPAFDAAFAAYQGNDYQTALRGFQPMADSGDPVSCFYVGRILEMGLAGTKDEVSAIRWYQQSAAGGINVAMSNIGYMLMEGRGTQKDPSKATDFFLMAAFAGAVDGAINIGFAYGTGQGRAKDVVEAHAWYSMAAGNGEEVGAKNLAALEKEMNPIQISNAKSRRQEIEQELRGERAPKYPVPMPLGSAGSPFPAAGADQGPGFNRPEPNPAGTDGGGLEDAMRAFQSGNEAEAKRILQGLAEGGNLEAMDGLAMLISESDPAGALRWLKQAYAGGAASAASSIAFLYYDGVLPQSSAVEAGAWLMKAAEAGDPEAKELVGELSEEFSAQEIAGMRKRALELPNPGSAPRPVTQGPAPEPGTTRRDGPMIDPRSAPPQGQGPFQGQTGPGGMQSFTFKDELMGGIASHTVQLPTGWNLEGGVSWNPQDSNACVSVDAVMRGQDGTQVQFLPSGSFMYFSEIDMPGAPPRPEEGQYRDGSMFLNPGNGPDDFVTRVVVRSYRPNAQNVQVVSSGEAAPVSQVYSDLLTPMIQQMVQNGSQNGIQTTHKIYCPLVRVSYTEGGQSFEEEFSFMYMRVDMTGQVQPGKTMTNTFWSVFEARGVRAPMGRLDQSLPMLRGVASSLEPTLDWNAVLEGLNTKVFADPQAFQKLQSQGYEQAIASLKSEASQMLASMDQTRASAQESWAKTQDANGRVRRAWAQMSGAGAEMPQVSPNPAAPAPRRGGFRIR